MSACKIVTIKAIHQLFKDDEKANAIELVELNEVGNTIITQLGLYQIGDKALFIQPDYSIPDTEFFKEYHCPGGDKSKSKLGSKGRVKAIKFNFRTETAPAPVYSYGILIPAEELKKITPDEDGDNLDKILGITKWEEPEPKGSMDGDSLPFPQGMYKTDEENINNLWNEIQYPIKLIGTWKIDGSSITIYCKKLSDGTWKSGICSRNLEKKLTTKKCIGTRKKTVREWIQSLFGKKLDLRVFGEMPSDNEFVKVGEPYLEALECYCKHHNISLALRGELCGKGLRGSGNKNNPSCNDEPNIKFYAIDFIDEEGIARRCEENTFATTINNLGFARCSVLFKDTFNSREQLENHCKDIFIRFKEDDKILIEGIVVKTLDGTWSAKFMNLEYDTRK